MPSESIRALDQRWYPNVQDNWDDQLLRDWVLLRLTPQSTALELGAGAGIVTQMNFRDHKPGGYFLAKTPNRWHYMPIIARLTPHAFHRFYNRLRGRASVDTFPTRYRANSIGQLRRLAAATGFEITRIEVVESRPEYLRMNRLTYWVGRLYERLVNSSQRLQSLRILLVVEMRKEDAATP